MTTPTTFAFRRLIALAPLLKLAFLPFAYAFPAYYQHENKMRIQHDTDDSDDWFFLICAGVLVLLGGAFAGLTIALMGQDEIYLQVLAASGEPTERKNASKVLRLLKRGKHWVLVTLLLGNVITNETLPIMLDRSLGGGWQAVLGSTVLIVIFGEIVPQSVCVRYGLPIGAFMAPFVLGLMWILGIIAWPTAKLLDYMLGEDHGTTYKKAGLKTLVTLHRTLGTSPDDRLNRDEVTIISAVLDLKEKPVGSIMTPMEDVFTLSADTVLDEEMMNTILSEGYSRIPIYMVDDPENFIGMLLVKMLITYDPEDCWRVDDFQLATLPETRPETSCLDIVNFFQEGKSHMVLVSANPGEATGALGVLTLEDVIEELIGEEIIDESDVFVDVHKAIRRINPVAYFRIPKSNKDKDNKETKENTDTLEVAADRKAIPRRVSGPTTISAPPLPEAAQRSKVAKMMKRRLSGGVESMAYQREDPEFRNHLRHLGPSNLASKPKTTRINTVKIKPGQAADGLSHISTQTSTKSPRERQLSNASRREHSSERDPKVYEPPTDASETTGLLSAGYPASDGVQAVNYGAFSTSPTQKANPFLTQISNAPTQPSPLRHTQSSITTLQRDISWALPSLPTNRKENDPTLTSAAEIPNPEPLIQITSTPPRQPEPSPPQTSSPVEPINSLPAKFVVAPEEGQSHPSSEDDDAQNPDEESSGQTGYSSLLSVPGSASGGRSVTRSGSIRERDLDFNGVRKVVLDVHDKHDESEEDRLEGGVRVDGDGTAEASSKKKKKPRKKKKSKKGKAQEAGASGTA